MAALIGMCKPDAGRKRMEEFGVIRIGGPGYREADLRTEIRGDSGQRSGKKTKKQTEEVWRTRKVTGYVVLSINRNNFEEDGMHPSAKTKEPTSVGE
ncbi:hypothetical protein L596_027796 [Steinernema carpocapsae]|uniref:Uncharacterized protein n=1 Tax=Steinernema carpocapsae TaxID=34508 RepID=A0A4U5LWK7_STECR|nr:hypothetical protein L596_027796 [Steinernema carpocapsae]